MKNEKDDNSENSLRRKPIFIIVVFGVFLLFFNAGCDALFEEDLSFGQAFDRQLYGLRSLIITALIVGGIIFFTMDGNE